MQSAAGYEPRPRNRASASPPPSGTRRPQTTRNTRRPRRRRHIEAEVTIRMRRTHIGVRAREGVREVLLWFLAARGDRRQRQQTKNQARGCTPDGTDVHLPPGRVRVGAPDVEALGEAVADAVRAGHL